MFAIIPVLEGVTDCRPAQVSTPGTCNSDDWRSAKAAYCAATAASGCTPDSRTSAASRSTWRAAQAALLYDPAEHKVPDDQLLLCTAFVCIECMQVRRGLPEHSNHATPRWDVEALFKTLQNPTCGDLCIVVLQSRLQVCHRCRCGHMALERSQAAAQLRVLRRQLRHLCVRQPASDLVHLRRGCYSARLI
jgi:hypothetical protein